MSEIRKDWINTLGVVLMSYATLTDGEFSEDEQKEIMHQLHLIVEQLHEGEPISATESDFTTRFREIKTWFHELKGHANFGEEFQEMVQEMPKLDFWSHEKSVIACKAIYHVADSDDEIEYAEGDVLTDIMLAWDVDIDEIEEG